MKKAAGKGEWDMYWALQCSFCVAIYMFRCPFIKESLNEAPRPSTPYSIQSEREQMLMNVATCCS